MLRPSAILLTTMLLLFGLVGCGPAQPMAQDKEGSAVNPTPSAGTSALSYEDIYQHVHQLIDSEKARTGSQYIHPEVFSESPELGAYIESLRGTSVSGWRGWVSRTGDLDLSEDGAEYYVDVNMRERATGPPRDADVVLRHVSAEQMSLLGGVHPDVSRAGGLQLIEFSGVVISVDSLGGVGLDAVQIALVSEPESESPVVPEEDETLDRTDSQESPTPGVVTIPTVDTSALSYDDINQSVRQLIENEKARTESGFIHPETFSELSEFQRYQASMRGLKVTGWRGWVTYTGNLQSETEATPKHLIQVNMREPKLSTTRDYNDYHVIMVGVAEEQMQKLSYLDLSDREHAQLPLIEFSGEIRTVNLLGDVTVTLGNAYLQIVSE